MKINCIIRELNYFVYTVCSMSAVLNRLCLKRKRVIARFLLLTHERRLGVNGRNSEQALLSHCLSLSISIYRWYRYSRYSIKLAQKRDNFPQKYFSFEIYLKVLTMSTQVLIFKRIDLNSII